MDERREENDDDDDDHDDADDDDDADADDGEIDDVEFDERDADNYSRSCIDNQQKDVVYIIRIEFIDESVYHFRRDGTTDKTNL